MGPPAFASRRPSGEYCGGRNRYAEPLARRAAQKPQNAADSTTGEKCGIVYHMQRCVSQLSRSTGFTLVEIMLVVSIAGLLAALALPSFMKARAESIRTACINNLRQMAAAKEMAAMAEGWNDSAGPSTVGNPGYRNTISQYIRGGQRPECPTGAECWYNALTVPPTCRSGIETHVYDGGE